LLQFFVDEIQELRSRSDSTILLNKAKDLRQVLLDSGWLEKDLPKLAGGAGKSWMLRWRREHGIVMKALGMKLKVAWRKVLKRVKTHLTNIFRVRAFWEKCHPGKPLRWISADQKPSWFNNAGHTGTYGRTGQAQPQVAELFAHTRQRYTILTIVRSWVSDTPPHLFVLFKGKKSGRIIRNILSKWDPPDWFKIQVQEMGSYREEDVIEALREILPVAASTEDSIIVILDWFSAHRTDKVIAFIQNRGHVVLFHGGGCTPFTQINDTHLHALVQSILIKLENQVALVRRTDMHLNGRKGIPTLARHDICDIVKTMWLMIDHAKVSKKGYEQTGPELPMQGPIKREQVFKDLRLILDEVDPAQGLEEIGVRLREDAKAFVEAGWPNKWSSWHHVNRLIEEHDDEDEPVPEGLEAFGYNVEVGGDSDDDDDGDGSDDDDDDNADDDGDDGGDSPGGGGGGDAEGRPGGSGGGDAEGRPDGGPDGDGDGAHGQGGHGHGDGDDGGDVDGVDGPGGGPGDADLDVACAREVMIADAKRRRDDVLLRRLLSQRDSAKKDMVDAATEVAQVLRKRALEQQAEQKEKLKLARIQETKAKTDQALAAQRKAEALHRVLGGCLFSLLLLGAPRPPQQTFFRFRLQGPVPQHSLVPLACVMFSRPLASQPQVSLCCRDLCVDLAMAWR